MSDDSTSETATSAETGTPQSSEAANRKAAAGAGSDSVQARLARRYPPSLLPQRVAVLLIVGVAALGLLWTVWTGVRMANPEVSGRMNTFEVLSDTDVTFNITIERRDPQRAASCRVIAQADNFERVGELQVEVPADGRVRVSVEQSMKTFRRAVSVSLDGCFAQ